MVNYQIYPEIKLLKAETSQYEIKKEIQSMLKDQKDKFYDTIYVSMDGNNRTQTCKRYMRTYTVKECVDRILTYLLRPFLTDEKFFNKELTGVFKQWILK